MSDAPEMIYLHIDYDGELGVFEEALRNIRGEEVTIPYRRADLVDAEIERLRDRLHMAEGIAAALVLSDSPPDNLGEVRKHAMALLDKMRLPDDLLRRIKHCADALPDTEDSIFRDILAWHERSSGAEP